MLTSQKRKRKLNSMQHRYLCKKYHLTATKNGRNILSREYCKNNEVKILWYVNIKINKHRIHNMSGITEVKKMQGLLIDVAISKDSSTQGF